MLHKTYRLVDDGDHRSAYIDKTGYDPIRPAISLGLENHPQSVYDLLQIPYGGPIKKKAVLPKNFIPSLDDALVAPGMVKNYDIVQR